MSEAMQTPKLQSAPASIDELDSSPPKRAGDEHMLSSPTKKRKAVKFSDELLPSSPLKHCLTPRRSILKTDFALSPVEYALGSKPSNDFSPHRADFWLPGRIVLLGAAYSDLPQLVDGCMSVLQNPLFERKFEVYATLNQVFKHNDSDTLALLVAKHKEGREKSKHLDTLCSLLRRDIELLEADLFAESSPGKKNPFQSRVLGQALRLVANVMNCHTLNYLVRPDDVKWFYSHACDSVKQPYVLKTLMLSYISVLKDFPFAEKMRKHVFEDSEQPLLERMLFAVLNSNTFSSSSLINEKYFTLKNLIQNFPSTMARSLEYWMPGVLFDLVNAVCPIYTKIVSSGVSMLLEAAKAFLGMPQVCAAFRKLMDSPPPEKAHSIVLNGPVDFLFPAATTAEYLSEGLEHVIMGGQSKFAMDIWVGITLLCGQFPEGLENWHQAHRWLQVQKCCFNAAKHTRFAALSAWKVIVFQVCCLDLPTLTNDSLHELAIERTEQVWVPKFKLLLHVFTGIPNLAELDIVDAFHDLFSSILYSLAPIRGKSKVLLFVWEKVLFPIVKRLYFRKEPDATLNAVGVAVFELLIKPLLSNERQFNPLRCLSNEPVSLAEINPFRPRWAYAASDKVLRFVALIGQLGVSLKSKLSTLHCFLNTIKPMTKPENEPSENTQYIMDDVLVIVSNTLKGAKPSHDDLTNLLLNLKDTFHLGCFFTHSQTKSFQNGIVAIVRSGVVHLSHDELIPLLNVAFSAMSEWQRFAFVVEVAKLNIELNNEQLSSMVTAFITSRKKSAFPGIELKLAGRLFKYVDRDFAQYAKRLIQHVVLLKAEELREAAALLDMENWNIHLVKFFVGLNHVAPFEHLQELNHRIIKAASARGHCAELMLFFVENNFIAELEKVRSLDEARFYKNVPKNWTAFVLGLEDAALAEQLFAGSIAHKVKIQDIEACLARFPQLRSKQNKVKAKTQRNISQSSDMVIDLTHEEEDRSLARAIIDVLGRMSESDMVRMDMQQRRNLETTLMQFVIRMRAVPPP